MNHKLHKIQESIDNLIEFADDLFTDCRVSVSFDWGHGDSHRIWISDSPELTRELAEWLEAKANEIREARNQQAAYERAMAARGI